MTRAGQFVWYEPMTKDQEVTKAFYTNVFGGETEAFGGDDNPYFVWQANHAPIGDPQGATVAPLQSNRPAADMS